MAQIELKPDQGNKVCACGRANTSVFKMCWFCQKYILHNYKGPLPPFNQKRVKQKKMNDQDYDKDEMIALARRWKLSKWEEDFIESIEQRVKPLTEGQLEKLKQIAYGKH